MLKNLRTYQLAVQFHKTGKLFSVPSYLRDQWLRASSSIVLNVAEGYGKPTSKDRARFYSIALGSLRECQGILDLSEKPAASLVDMADHLGGALYKLIRLT